MTEQEEILKKVVGMWAGGEGRSGLEGTLDSWRQYAAPDLVWWNNARGAVVGLDACLDAIRGFYEVMGADHTKTSIRLMISKDDVVVIERSDDTYRPDGSLLGAVPIVGVVKFRDGKIVEWRDYCDDWVLKLGHDVNAEFDTA